MSLHSKGCDFPDVLFDNTTIQTLQDILEKQDECTFHIDHGLREIWFKGDNGESELRLLTLSTLLLTVSRVQFSHKRKGTMTKVFSILKDFCERNGVQQILVQSVQTPEMEAWCSKNKLTPDPGASYLYNGHTFGNWIYTL